MTVNGPAGATGSVTLTITGGMLGDKTATIGQVLALANLDLILNRRLCD